MESPRASFVQQLAWLNAERGGDLAQRVQFRVRSAVLNPTDKLLEYARIGRKRVLGKALGQSQPTHVLCQDRPI